MTTAGAGRPAKSSETPYYVDDWVTLYLGDCREIDAWHAADVIVTDPPYGINLDASYGKQVNPNRGHRAIEGDAEPFDPSHLLAAVPRAVIFGGNNFASRLPDSGSWVVWDKTIRNDVKIRIADAELAWTNCLRRTRTFHHLWSGAFRATERGTSFHPSQKPLSLMTWVVELVSRPGQVVADPYAGSGSTLVAAKATGRKAVGVEIDERYAKVAASRLRQEFLDYGKAFG